MGPGAPPPARGKPKRGLLAVVLVLVGVLALGGIAFAIVRATSGSSGGEKNPEAAARALAEAVAAEDPAAAIATMNPAEVRTLGELYEDVEDQAAELGFAGKGDKTFAGIDLTTEGLTYKVEELGSDVAKVTVTGGSLGYDVRTSQLAPQVQAILEQEAADDDDDPGVPPKEPEERTTGSFTPEDIPFEGEDRGRVDAFLMMVKRDGGWYVSPMYTAAEYVVELNGFSPGNFDEKDAEATADSPTEAVERLSEAIADADADAATAQLSDDELAILRTYRAALTELIDDSFTLDGDIEDTFSATIESLELEEEPLDDGAVKVVITAVRGTATWTEDGDEQRSDFTWDGRCLAITSDDSGDSEDCITGDTRRLGLTEAFLVAVEEDGGWRVSPVSTLLEYGRQILPHLDRPLVNRLTALQYTDDATGEVTLGEPVEVKLNDAGYAVYDLELDEGDAFTYSVEEDEAYALLYGPDGRFVDGFGFDVVEITTAGTYKVVIQQDALATGTATVTVQPVEEEDLTLGEEVDGELDNGDEVVDYVFDVEADQELSIDIDNPDLDTTLLDPDGDEVDETADGTYVIEEDGEHRVRVSTFDESGGDFTLVVDEAFDFRLGDGTTDAAEGTIGGPGSVVTIDLEVQGGATVDVVVTPLNAFLDVIVTVVDTDGTQTPYNSRGPGLDEGVTFFPDETETFELRIAAVNNVRGDVTVEAFSTDE
jgi:hypothetical protein